MQLTSLGTPYTHCTVIFAERDASWQGQRKGTCEQGAVADGQEIQLGGLFRVQGWQPNIKREWRQVRGWPRRGPTAGFWLEAILGRRDGGRIPPKTRGGPRKRSTVHENYACDSPISCFNVLLYSCFIPVHLDSEGEQPTSEGAWQGRDLWSAEKSRILISGRV